MKTPLFITVLIWIALGTLMMAITNELSMVKLAQGAEGFTSGPLNGIVQMRPQFTREGPIPEQKGGLVGGGPVDAMVEWRGQPQMTGLGKYLGVDNASEDLTNAGKKDTELTGENPELGSRRKPFQLLGDVMQSIGEDAREPNTKQTAEHCYNADFEAQTQKVRSYSQRTNNYKRAGPDSCSAPTHELVGNFYRAPTIPLALPTSA